MLSIRKGKKLGDGSYGRVYKATGTAEDLAFKETVIDENDSNEFSVPQHTVRELLILNSLNHPHVIRMEGYILDKDYYGFVMKNGKMSLHTLVRDRFDALTDTIIAQIMYQMLQGLQHIHSNGILHRDLKPGNLLVESLVKEKIQVQIIDFGLSRWGLENCVQSHVSTPYCDHLERNGELVMSRHCFTQGYRPPEVLLGGSYDQSGDLWSVGCIMHYLITGDELIDEENNALDLMRLFDLFGTPDPNSWPGIVKCRYWYPCFPKWPKRSLEEFYNESRHRSYFRRLPNPLQIDFLSKMMVINPNQRWKCEQLLAHPYFDGIST